jgi:hypothetical protein
MSAAFAAAAAALTRLRCLNASHYNAMLEKTPNVGVWWHQVQGKNSAVTPRLVSKA